MSIHAQNVKPTIGIRRTTGIRNYAAEADKLNDDIFQLELALAPFARLYCAKYQGCDLPDYAIIAQSDDGHYVTIWDLREAYRVCEAHGRQMFHLKPGVSWDVEPGDLLDYELIVEWSQP